MSAYTSPEVWLRCRIFGCLLSPDGYSCWRCGAHIYEDWIEIGWIRPVVRPFVRLWDLRHRIRNKCPVCGRVFWFRDLDGPCSEECFSEWIPF